MATAVPATVERARAVAGDHNENDFFTKAESDYSASSEMVHEVFENSEEQSMNAAPTDCCSTSGDQKERIELVVADAAIDERDKSSNTMAGAENACQGRGLVFGFERNDETKTKKTPRLPPAAALQSIKKKKSLSVADAVVDEQESKCPNSGGERLSLARPDFRVADWVHYDCSCIGTG